MTKEKRTYYLDLSLSVEFTGDEMPEEEVLLTPIKAYIKKQMKAYKNTSRMVALKTNIYESDFEDVCEKEDF